MSVQTQIDRITGEVDQQTDLISQIKTALAGKGSSGEVALQSKTVTPTTQQQTVTPDEGYTGLSEVTVEGVKTAEQATPAITVDGSGLITATAEQSEGYVTAGAKSATKQLTVQEAKTVTPGTAEQTAVAAGAYTTGAVKVAGDANLLAGNIKSGVTIFGVTGSYEGSESDSSESTVTISNKTGYNIKIGAYALAHNASVRLPLNLTTLGQPLIFNTDADVGINVNSSKSLLEAMVTVANVYIGGSNNQIGVKFDVLFLADVSAGDTIEITSDGI